MALVISLCLVLLPLLTAAAPHNTESPSLINHRRNVNCRLALRAMPGSTCGNFGITIEHFESLNPDVSCLTMLVAGEPYCVLGEVRTQTSTSTNCITISKRDAATSTTSAFPFEPTQAGLAANCDAFYLVQPGDTCSAIVAKYDKTLTQFYSWNPAVGLDCTNMWAGYWVCVGVSNTTNTSATPPSTPNITTAPQPQMPGTVSNCKKFYLVQSGDSCYSIEQANGVTLAELLAWNTMVNPACTNLWLGYYICIGV